MMRRYLPHVKRNNRKVAGHVCPPRRAWGRGQRLVLAAVCRGRYATPMFERKRSVGRAVALLMERVAGRDLRNHMVILSTLHAIMKMNGSEQRIEHEQRMNFRRVFSRPARDNRETLVRRRSLCEWFSSALGATPYDSQEVKMEAKSLKTKGWDLWQGATDLSPGLKLRAVGPPLSGPA